MSRDATGNYQSGGKLQQATTSLACHITPGRLATSSVFRVPTVQTLTVTLAFPLLKNSEQPSTCINIFLEQATHIFAFSLFATKTDEMEDEHALNCELPNGKKLSQLRGDETFEVMKRAVATNLGTPRHRVVLSSRNEKKNTPDRATPGTVTAKTLARSPMCIPLQTSFLIIGTIF